jgi:hypothetical protein
MAGMKYRKLRIAWSATCGLACLLLIVLWVRSYFWIDSLANDHSTGFFSIGSYRGKLNCLRFEKSNLVPVTQMGWRWGSKRITELPSPPKAVPTTVGFAWNSYNNGVHVFVPYWFLCTVAAGFAALPWLPWAKSFSLRTLLIGMTVVAVVLGLVIWAVK